MNRSLVSLASSLALGASLSSTAAFADPAQHLAAQAKVSLARARAIAVHAVPGRIKTEELEKEAGGSGLRYTFDIVRAGKTYEVGVDARSGTVLEKGIDNG